MQNHIDMIAQPIQLREKISFMPSSDVNGVHYFAQGWKLISLPGIRRFVVIPLLVNILLMGGAFWWLFTKMGQWIPGPDESRAVMATLAGLFDLADSRDFCATGVQLLLQHDCQPDCRTF